MYVCVCVDWVKIFLDKRVHCENRFEKKRLLMLAALWERDNGREHLKPLRSSVTLA